MTNEEFIKSISLEGEEWRGIVGYEDMYMVSSYGRIISIPHDRIGAYGCVYKTKHKLRSIMKDKNGYLRINLSPLVKKTSLVHRLVAEAFIPNPDNKPEVDHIDCNPSNAHVSNLRWTTSSENGCNPITRKNMSKALKGTLNNSTSKKIVLLKGDEIILFPSVHEAQRNGFPRTCIYRCLSNIQKEYKGYKAMYLSDYEALTNKSKNAIPNPN